jgi:muconate cycloisomerase
LAKGDIEGAKTLRTRTPLKIIADESACSLEDVTRLIHEDACDMINVKISKCGGLDHALEIAENARRADKSLILGAHVAETGILESAGRIFASLVREVCYCEGSLSDFIFDEPVVVGPQGFDRRCLAPLSPAPGLGVEMRMDRLDRYTLRRTSIRMG